MSGQPEAVPVFDVLYDQGHDKDAPFRVIYRNPDAWGFYQSHVCNYVTARHLADALNAAGVDPEEGTRG